MKRYFEAKGNTIRFTYPVIQIENKEFVPLDEIAGTGTASMMDQLEEYSEKINGLIVVPLWLFKFCTPNSVRSITEIQMEAIS